MEILSVQELVKKYPAFTLGPVSFSLEEGYILGFIGRNGAGKTTTLKSMIGFVHPDAGSVSICGMDFRAQEDACKRAIGVVFGEFPYYLNKKLSAITAVTRAFYDKWDEERYRVLVRDFALDESKRINQLSAGMRVKYSLALALSHNARLLLLDEPTSGLDPVSRDELMQIFRDIVSDGEHSILFSTHILSDLDRCADQIVYIRDGKILENCDIESLRDKYSLVSGTKAQLESAKDALFGCQENAFGFIGLMKSQDRESYPDLTFVRPTVEDIMVYREKEERA